MRITWRRRLAGSLIGTVPAVVVAQQATTVSGTVVSDANVVRNLVTHGFAADARDAAARALDAGVDMEMAIQDPAYAHLTEALVKCRRGSIWRT